MTRKNSTDRRREYKIMNAGEETVKWLFQGELQVEQKWSVKIPQGSIWWPDQNAQRIEIIGSHPAEETLFIRVQTDMLRDVVLNEESLPRINLVMSLASRIDPLKNQIENLRQTRDLLLRVCC